MKNKLRSLLFLTITMECLVVSAQVQTSGKKISGTVYDSKNEIVIGAAVSIVGSTNGAVTDMDGKYALTVPVGSIIKVTYLGYVPYQEKVVTSKSIYNVVLKEDLQALDEIVVVGYGTQKRSELTGSISSVKANDIKDFSVNSVADALSGMAAGVMVTKSTGAPGETPDILIRGAASVNGMAPLYIVDGVKQGTGFDFNMRDIESIEVLKDAGSCAIYGAEAAGGVILITTKRGVVGTKATVNATARFGVRNVMTDINLMNRDQFIAAKQLINSNILAQEGVDNASELPDVDWMDVMYDTGIEQEYNISVSGASEKLQYYVSGGYYSEEGTFIDSKADRFSIRTNVDYAINKRVQIGTSIYGNLRKNNPTKVYSVYTNCLPFRTVPTMRPTDEDGNFSQTPSYLNGPNLYGNELSYHYKDKNYGLNILAYLNVNIIKDLDFKVTGAGKFGSFSKRVFSEAFDFRSVKENAFMESEAGTSQELTYNATLTFDRTFGNHSLKVMIGSEATKYDAYSNYIRAIDFPIDYAESINISSNPNKEASDAIGVGRAMSFFGRVNYTYRGKYLLTANVRRDGSDRFGAKNRWGTFPSVNVAWRLGEEKFIKENCPWLSNAKLRGSYGILGNDGIGQFLYQEAYVGDQIIYNFGGKGDVQGWANFKVPNEEIKWEEVHQGDFGIDLGFLNNRLSVTYDYYNRQTRDMLYWRVVPLASGIGYYTSVDTQMPINIGKVSNKGHELTISWKDHVKDFNYTVGFNASFNRNKVLEVGEKGAAPLVSADGINRTENGRSMSMLYGYEAIGIFQTKEQVAEYNAKAQAAGRPYYWKEKTGVGDLIFNDFGQGYINESCQTFIGNPWPKMIYGINIQMNYKGFDLSMLFQGATGFDLYNGVKKYTQNFADDGNTTMDIYKNSFFGDNGLTDQPRCGLSDDSGKWYGDPSNNYSTVSSFWVEKGNYLKLKNLVIGYSLPERILKKAAIEKVRVYMSASNLFTITKYSGIDPEIAGTSTETSNQAGTTMTARGVDTHNRYLPSRLFSFGIDITF